jgi:hypothetical protein
MICRTCYVHPAVIGAYMDGTLARRDRRPSAEAAAASTALSTVEADVLALIRKRGQPASGT